MTEYLKRRIEETNQNIKIAVGLIIALIAGLGLYLTVFKKKKIYVDIPVGLDEDPFSDLD